MTPKHIGKNPSIGFTMSEATIQFFEPRLLTRCLMSEKDAESFRQKSQMHIVRDEATDARVVCYIHPDGRFLIDAVHLSNK